MEEYTPKVKDVAIAITGSVDSGKCFAPGTLVRMYNDYGYKPQYKFIEQIRIGDYVMGDDFTPKYVYEVHNGFGQMFEITTYEHDGFERKYFVNSRHILCLKRENNNKIYEMSVKTFMEYNIEYKSKFRWFRHYEFINNNNFKLSYDIELVKFDIKYVYEGYYFGFSISGNKRFLLSDNSVVHNSSTIGVIISNELDDGNGSARLKVAKHNHEITSGKTSDISTRIITNGERDITLVDLCGHEKYLKTTTFGLTGYFPDYGFVIVAANRGILKMTKEHLGILFYMKIPIVIIVTRIDIAPKEIYENTISNIRRVGKIFNKKIVFINNNFDLNASPDIIKHKENEGYEMLKENIKKMQFTDDIIPVICISNKTGYFVPVLKKCLYDFEPRKLWNDYNNDLKTAGIFYIESVYNPPGIGLVLSGIVKGQSIKQGDVIYMGPYNNDFVPIRIRSIHNNNRELTNELQDHQRGCIAIASVDKKIDINRGSINKGMIAISDLKLLKSPSRKMTKTFKAEVEILHHSASIRLNYSPVIHMGPIRQTAKITNIMMPDDKVPEKNEDNQIILKTKDKAIIDFEFIVRPEFLEKETIFFFREGTTRGVGKIVDIT